MEKIEMSKSTLDDIIWWAYVKGYLSGVNKKEGSLDIEHYSRTKEFILKDILHMKGQKKWLC